MQQKPQIPLKHTPEPNLGRVDYERAKTPDKIPLAEMRRDFRPEETADILQHKPLETLQGREYVDTILHLQERFIQALFECGKWSIGESNS